MTALMWRGLKIGAISMGLLGFIAGISICIAFKLPIPPVAVTEVTALLGACLGVLIGWSWPDPTRRLTLGGLAAGFLAGLLWCLMRHHFEPLAWGAWLLLGGFLGHQAAARDRLVAGVWRLHR